MTDLLTIRGASKSYNGSPALIDADLTLRAGEVHALMGENGAGKSTLIKILAGIVSPDAVQIHIDGTPVNVHSAQAAHDLGLRFIHQELNVVPQLSIAENIFLGQPYPTYLGTLIRWRALNAKAKAVLNQLGVTHLQPNHLMARLSPGDQMLVNIARAFVGDDLAAGSTAKVYVMDEPTASLTGQEIDQLFSVINRLKERGCAVLYVSHRLDEIFRISDRITVMRDGRVVNTHPITDVTPDDLIFMMTGREVKQVYPQRTKPISPEVLLQVDSLRTAHVQNVSFELRKGEILGIAGLNGAGRSEVLRGLMGADRVLSGTIRYADQVFRRMSPTKAWQERIAFVPEERRSQGLVMSHSVSRNITLPQLRHLSHGGVVLAHAVERRTSQTLGTSVRLKARNPGQIVRQLSGGNQQKVLFARALTRDPRILLLDEPTRGVDVGAKTDIYALIREINDNGTGIIMVSSDLPELLGMTDRILIMRNGQLVDTVQTSGLTEERLLALCYGEISHGGSRTE